MGSRLVGLLGWRLRDDAAEDGSGSSSSSVDAAHSATTCRFGCFIVLECIENVLNGNK